MNTHAENTKRIAKNTLILYVRMLFGMAVSLYTSRVVLQVLGVEDYGIYNVVGGVVTMFTLLSNSISTSISRFITFELGRGDIQNLKKVINIIGSAKFAFIVILLILFLSMVGSIFSESSVEKLKHNAFISLIFNPNIQFKLKDKAYLYQLESSAHAINRLFPQDSPQQLLVLEHFDANIILPYLNDNIALLNQTMTDFTTLKAFNESLYHMYIPINRYTIIDAINVNPNILLYRSCGKNFYQNELLTFNLKYRLNDKYCIYTINSRF